MNRHGSSSSLNTSVYMHVCMREELEIPDLLSRRAAGPLEEGRPIVVATSLRERKTLRVNLRHVQCLTILFSCLCCPCSENLIGFVQILYPL